MLATLKNAIAPRHLGLAGLCILAFAYMALFRYDNFGIEESAARALLINWSIIHQIASPAGMYGIPDLRAILFILLDLHWAGSLPAAKVFTMLVLFGSGLLLYRWSEKQHGEEAAMIASGLLLISPIALMQTDAVGGGAYLLGAFVLSHMLEDAYRHSPRTISSWLFLIALMTALAVSIHPMGLAVPLVLGWQWLRQKPLPVKGRNLMIGIGIVTVLFLLLRWGWSGIGAAAANPLVILGDALFGPSLIHAEGEWGVGLILIDLLAIVAAVHLWKRTTDTLSLILIAASVIGLFHADHMWVLVAYATLLYLGAPLLIQANQRFGWRGLVGQRGAVMLCVFVLATVSMVTARSYQVIGAKQLKSDTDAVIAVLAEEAENPKVPFVAASQWPGRSLLACRRDVLPLPPARQDQELFRKQIKGLTHIAFDPQLPKMHDLARNVAALSNEMETIALLPGGVVLKSRNPQGLQ